MADSPLRDSVDETSPLLPGDAQAQPGAASATGPAEPSAPDQRNERIPAHFSIKGAITGFRVLLVASATSLLLGCALLITYLTGNSDSEHQWWLAHSLPGFGLLSFLTVFLSVVNLVLLAQARERNETTPSPFGTLINVAALGLLCVFHVGVTSNITEEWRWRGSERVGGFEAVLFLWVIAGVLVGWVILPGLVIVWLRGLIIWIWNTGSSVTWSLPGGQLTVEASIKFHRQEPLREAQESA